MGPRIIAPHGVVSGPHGLAVGCIMIQSPFHKPALRLCADSDESPTLSLEEEFGPIVTEGI